ncbi:DICT sensory domain-containing protein [Fortiea contorta]|uniref:DICT sensory domain-containing protein n=1 Tax=Fortiea contorta TaxID=1892405 RepID=UPI00034719A8|nr:DICT sensory domain-containing protein [Fortiea contorta]
MNESLAQDLSLYQIALGVQEPPQQLCLSPATLLSLVKSQIDLLIERQIQATVWVKLPPGKIWYSELTRYQSSVNAANVIYNCQLIERRRDRNSSSSPSPIHIKAREEFRTEKTLINQVGVQLLPNRSLQREYFLLVLSPQFSSLIVARRPLKRRKTRLLPRTNTTKTPPLLTITTLENKVIQEVLDGIKQQVRTPAVSAIAQTDFICSTTPEPALISQLLAQQLQRQNEVNRQIITRQLGKLRQQNQQLQKKEQLKDEYLSNVCQELRTPLTHMKTSLSLLNSPNLKPQQKQRYFQMLNTQCDRQNSLISGLLALVNLERNLAGMALETVHLSDIVPGVVSTYQPVAQEKGIMLAYTIPTELPPVRCVSGGVRLIVINLLHNSIKFTTNGGQVWVRARAHGDYVQLEFRDTGVGIAENEIPKIFDSFYRARSSATEDSNAPGLGLTIVQQLLWRSGGSISVKSKLYEGSSFVVQLAIARDSVRI